MVEEEKSLKEVVTDLAKKVDEATGVKKQKTKINIPILGWIISLVIGGCVFTLTWLLWDLTGGIIIGLTILFISLYISHVLSTGQWMPLKARFLGRRKKRKGYVVFVNLGENKAVTFNKLPIDEGVAMVNGAPHTINSEDVFLWKNKIPMVFTFQGALTPIRAKDLENKANVNGSGTKGWQYIMNYIYKTQIKDKKTISMTVIIIGLVVVCGLGYFLIRSGAFK